MNKTTENKVRCITLAKIIADELGLPFSLHATGPVEATTTMQVDRNPVRFLSCGYLPTLEGTPGVVAARLSDMLDGIRAFKSAVSAGHAYSSIQLSQFAERTRRLEADDKRAKAQAQTQGDGNYIPTQNEIRLAELGKTEESRQQREAESNPDVTVNWSVRHY